MGIYKRKLESEKKGKDDSGQEKKLALQKRFLSRKKKEENG